MRKEVLDEERESRGRIQKNKKVELTKEDWGHHSDPFIEAILKITSLLKQVFDVNLSFTERERRVPIS